MITVGICFSRNGGMKLIQKELVFVNEPLNTQKEVIEKLTDEVYKMGWLKSKEEFIKAVLKREEEFSTAIGHNFAIPHGKSNTVTQSFIVYLKTARKFKWNEKDDHEVDTIFMIGVAEHEKNIPHLRFLSKISKNLMNEDFRKSLDECKNRDETYQLLDQINGDIRKETI